MTETLTCLPIARTVIQTPVLSRYQWDRTLAQASSKCVQAYRCGGECQIKKCLDTCLLHMLYEGSQEAERAIQYIYPLYFKDLLNYVQEQGCAETQEAEDIVQTVLIDFFVRAQKVNIQLREASLKVYLCHAVKNRWIDKTRTKPFRGSTSDKILTNQTDTGQITIEQELEKQKRIYALLQKIFPKTQDNCSKIMRYYFFKLMSYEEIMETEVGKSYGSVEALRNKVHRCSEKFKRVLADEALLREFADIYGKEGIKLNRSGDHHEKR